MEDIKDKTAMQKTQIFNVIILDRSGSMQRIRQAAVDGFNETLVGIKKAQEKFADTQEHFVSPDFDYASPILKFPTFHGQNRHFCLRLVSSGYQTRA